VTLHRRAALKSLVAGCLAAGTGAGGSQPARASDPLGRIRIWDTHSHLDDLPGDTPEARMAVLVQHMAAKETLDGHLLFGG
jgi:hypothetical protein